jgi:hypothetical protein
MCAFIFLLCGRAIARVEQMLHHGNYTTECGRMRVGVAAPKSGMNILAPLLVNLSPLDELSIRLKVDLGGSVEDRE